MKVRKVYAAVGLTVLVGAGVYFVRTRSAHPSNQGTWPTDIQSVPLSVLPPRNKSPNDPSRAGALTNEQILAFFASSTGVPVPQIPTYAEGKWSAAWSSNGYPSGVMIAWIRLPPEIAGEYLDAVHAKWKTAFGTSMRRNEVSDPCVNAFKDWPAVSRKNFVTLQKSWREDWSYAGRIPWEDDAYYFVLNTETGDLLLQVAYGPDKVIREEPDLASSPDE
jgi:hypothetical protein